MKCMRQVAWLCVLLIIAGAAEAQRSSPSGSAVTYLAGGVGEGSMEALKAHEKDFNLKLVFTLAEGNYLAGVDVSIIDAGGKGALQHFADGPVFLVRLPPGDYTVKVNYEGAAQTRKVKVGDRLRTEYLRWPSKAGVDYPLPQGKERAVAIVSVPRMMVVAGGVGEHAQGQLEAIEKRYNLKLVFTLTEGNYVADVDVSIKDAQGRTVVERFVGGPMLMAQLPFGPYTVAATYRDKTESRQIKVGKQLKTEYFRWPSKTGEDFPLR